MVGNAAATKPYVCHVLLTFLIVFFVLTSQNLRNAGVGMLFMDKKGLEAVWFFAEKIQVLSKKNQILSKIISFFSEKISDAPFSPPPVAERAKIQASGEAQNSVAFLT